MYTELDHFDTDAVGAAIMMVMFRYIEPRSRCLFKVPLFFIWRKGGPSSSRSPSLGVGCIGKPFEFGRDLGELAVLDRRQGSLGNQNHPVCHGPTRVVQTR